MSNYNKRALILIPASYQEQANIAALAFDPVGGLTTFTIGLSETGLEPASHFWASFQLREQTFSAIQNLLAVNFPLAAMIEYDLDSEPEKPSELLEAWNLKVVNNP